MKYKSSRIFIFSFKIIEYNVIDAVADSMGFIPLRLIPL